MKKNARTSSNIEAMRGATAACVTPRREGELNVELSALLEVIDFVCSAGIDGIVLFGSTGEFVHFEKSDRARAVSLAVKRSRCPIYVNVSQSTLDGALALADESAACGAHGVLLMPPVYFIYDQETIREYYLRFLDCLRGILPAYLYNIPAFASGIAVETAAELVSAGFAGIKDSSGDAAYFSGLLEACADSPAASILAGSESIYAQFRKAGAAGVVSGFASAVPELVVALDSALCRGDDLAASRLNARLGEFGAWFRQFPVPVAIREAANLRGLRAGPPAAPLGPVLRHRLDEFRAWFPGWLKETLADAALARRAAR